MNRPRPAAPRVIGNPRFVVIADILLIVVVWVPPRETRG